MSTPTSRGGLTPLAKGVIVFLLLVAAFFAVKQFVPGLFGGDKKSAQTAPSVPPKADIPTGPTVAGNPSTVPPRAAVPTVAPPTSAKAGCAQLPEVRMLHWAWNAQQGLLFATGGKQSVEGSLMCQNGVNLKLTRQDMVDQMQAELIKCATELGQGASDCSQGAHFVAIMGDGAAAFFAALNPQLKKICPDCTAEIVASGGYSRGEDQFMGLPAWKQDPKTASGALIAGYLRDGDWNIAMKWAGDNGVCNNPDETTFDPNCLNWVNASDYIDAAAKYVAGYCEDRPVVASGKRTGKTRKVCVNGVVTWTPGDVNVAQGRGGLVPIASTKDYIYQMPNVVIGIRRWNQTHRPQVVGFIKAMTDGGQQVKQNPAARARAAEISAVVYGEKDAAYWAKYFNRVTETDAQGLTVELGGSSVNNLADNRYLFGMASGQKLEESIFGATYKVFGDIVVHYYPDLVPSYPPVAAVVDTSYIEEVHAKTPTLAEAELPSYVPADPSAPLRPAIGSKNWSISFKSGSADFTPEAYETLNEIYRQTVVTNTTIELTGHTDADGDAAANRALSMARAAAVREYLKMRNPTAFPDSRFSVDGRGEDDPIADNKSAAGKAKNRRVAIVMREQ